MRTTKSTANVFNKTISVEGRSIFYREAGQADSPKLLLLHGFPTSSHMFRDLIPMLAGRYHLVATDFPGFGQSDMPDRNKYNYTFSNIANTIAEFTDQLGLKKFAIYIFDYGAPVGLRIALKLSDRISAIISQNGNAYEEGLSDGWNPIRAYWNDPSRANRDALRVFLKPETTTFQYTHGVARPQLGISGWPFAGRFLSGSFERRRSAARSLERLCDQRGALSSIPGIFPQIPAATAGGLGKE